MIIRYCLQCGERLESADTTAYRCPYGHEFFNNPHAGVSVVFMRGHQFLAAKRGIEPHRGKYGFVGGFLNYGEDPKQAARREVQEETGVQLESIELLDVQTQQYGDNETALSIVFVARQWHGEFAANDDAASLAWKPLELIESPEFAWHYPGLLAKLQAIADNT